MQPSLSLILGVVALFDAAIFWFIGQAVAAGHLKKPFPPHASKEQQAELERLNRLGGVAVQQGALPMAAMGLAVMVLPLPSQQLILLYVAAMLAIVGWILYAVFIASRARRGTPHAGSRAGDDPDLPIR